MINLPFATSEVLDPEFCADLEGMANQYADNQGNADDDKWSIASRVNEWWSEHKGLFESKQDYFAECSRVMNNARSKKRRKYFSDSGETLRRWCELQARYIVFETEVDRGIDFLDLLSFDHLYRAAWLAKREKVKSPFEALAEAVRQDFTAEEMQFHFDPPTKPDEWDVMTDRVQAMKSKDFWKLRYPQNVKRVIEHVNEIEKILKEDRQ